MKFAAGRNCLAGRLLLWHNADIARPLSSFAYFFDDLQIKEL